MILSASGGGKVTKDWHTQSLEATSDVLKQPHQDNVGMLQARVRCKNPGLLCVN